MTSIYLLKLELSSCAFMKSVPLEYRDLMGASHLGVRHRKGSSLSTNT